MFFNLDCLLGSVPTLLSLSTVTDDDLGSLLAYLDGSQATPANGSQRLLFRLVDDMRAKQATPADYAEVRDLIAARLAGELVCEVIEYDDEDEDFIYDAAPVLDDDALYQLYKEQPNGDGQRAFATLVERYRPILASYLKTTLLVSDPTKRDSVAEAVFDQLAGVADKFNAGTSSVASWMFWLAKRQLKSI